MRFLIVIPARGGSKGIPGKNIKLLNGKPLICYTIDIARELAKEEDDICVSTDSNEIISVVENYGLKVRFIRPAALASDSSATNDVLVHALNFYEGLGRSYDIIVLLQPTSPLRKTHQVAAGLKMFTPEIDMVVSVKQSHSAAVICNENKEGFLELTLSKNGVRRQDSAGYYEYNGAFYIINIASLKKFSLKGFTKTVKYVMPDDDSIDIDDMLDWQLCEILLKNRG
jgi:CMP-N,N'-diacetyllegionaminic acid synthase